MLHLFPAQTGLCGGETAPWEMERWCLENPAGTFPQAPVPATHSQRAAASRTVPVPVGLPTPVLIVPG